ncbi:hypothetical protein DL98DRAFT_655050 [Cadophora sp. DSE1049]|nr:hypothetical protein DL98DRAFT_655050 [Cadophora sp. DSE1049]
MHFISSITFTLAVLSGLSPLGLANPLSAHISVDVEDVPGEVFGTDHASNKIQRKTDVMMGSTLDDPVYTYGYAAPHT